MIDAGHPWILFYTARTLKTLPLKTKMKNHLGAPSHQLAIRSRLKFDRNRIDDGSFNDNSSSFSSSDSCKSADEDDDSELVDALATAVSRVRISEPKRSRLCVPAGPIEQQRSSNLNANNLCKAF
uniref:Uncharacterized protein n=1 Tax=Cannabis sativa TaxID=3483 RepID=A0A803QV68_CANSA